MTDTTEPTKEEWIAALRSGKYKQGVGGLQIRSKFCCLGVLCDIDPRVEWEKRMGIFNAVDRTTGVSRAGWPPSEYTWMSEPMAHVVSSWNDNEGLTFIEIADRFERGR